MLTLSEPEPQLWDRFKRGRLSARDVADEPVVARWARARALGAPARSGGSAAGLRHKRDAQVPLALPLADVEPLMCAAAAQLRRDDCALLLADAEGVIVRSYGADLFVDPELRNGLAEGVRWHEAERGTNAIGTALAERTAVCVVGGAHYEQAARSLACYAAPVRDGAGNIVAVLDISAPGSAADPRFGVVVQELASSIEPLLRRRPTTTTAPLRFGRDGTFSGIQVAPAGAPRGRVLLLHDVWGLDEQIERAATELGAAGYFVTAPDLYAREGERPVPLTAPRLAKLRAIFDGGDETQRAVFDELFTIAAAREQLRIMSSLHLLTANRSVERHLPVARAAARQLRRETGPRRRIAIVGFGAGGALALATAARGAERNAIVVVDGNGADTASCSAGTPVFRFAGAPGGRLEASVVARILLILRTQLA